MPFPLFIPAVIAGANALYGIGKGISQNAKANSIDKNNPRPTYQIPQEYIDNVNMAKQMARVGLPQQQYNNQVNAIARNQASGLQTLGRSANPGSGVASVVRAGNDANNMLNAQDAAARQQNQRFLIGQNSVLGSQKLAQQQYNKFDRYTENFNRAQGLRGAANANIQNGVTGAANMAANLAFADTGAASAAQPAANTNTWGNMGDYQYRGGQINPSPFSVGSYSPVANWGYQAPFNFGTMPKMPKNLY